MQKKENSSQRRRSRFCAATSASHRLWPSVSTSLGRIELHAAEQQSQLRGIELQSFRTLLVPRHLVVPAF
jgi:hypothetical protein